MATSFVATAHPHCTISDGGVPLVRISPCRSTYIAIRECLQLASDPCLAWQQTPDGQDMLLVSPTTIFRNRATLLRHWLFCPLGPGSLPPANIAMQQFSKISDHDEKTAVNIMANYLRRPRAA